MPRVDLIPTGERDRIEELIRSFDNHGCGFGLDLKAQAALRLRLDALTKAEDTIAEYEGRKEASAAPGRDSTAGMHAPGMARCYTSQSLP